MPFALSQSRRGAALFLGLSLAGFAAACTATADTATFDSGRTNAPVVCEIALDAVPGGTRLSGIVTAREATAGTWEMQISSRSSGGSTSIRQSGDFTARAGRAETITETTLTGTPAAQSVDLSIRVGGQRLSCADPSL